MKAKTFAQKLDHFQADSIWLDQNYERLKDEYPDHWMAVYGKAIIDHSKNLTTLMKRLRRKFGKGTGDIVVRFVSTEEVIRVV